MVRFLQPILVSFICAFKTCLGDEGTMLMEPISDANVKGSTNMDGHFYGRFPADLRYTKSSVRSIDLKRPDVTGNGMYGSLPTQIGLFRVLTSLIIHENDITGSLPTQIGALRIALSDKLEVWGNPKMGGPLPTELGELVALTGSLVLDGPRHCKGTLPTELGQLTYLGDRIVITNPRKRQGKASHVDAAVVGAAGLTGTLPSELGMLTSVKEIVVEGHDFNGVVPTELGMLSSGLQRGLVLADNHRLGGAVPTELGKLRMLKVRLKNSKPHDLVF